jgi:DNA repair exonuclease SbcCD ATPase subunit
MIERLEIKNVQSHKRTVMNFDAGLNVIVGATDSGKSAIIRAMQYAIYGRPNGDSIMSAWAKGLEVSLTIDGKEVTRKREKSKDTYILSGKNKREFTAFGTEIPAPVKKVINMTEINLQEQMDSPFLLSENAGTVARTFNKVANLDKIDSSLQNISREVNSIKSKISFLSDEKEKAIADVDKFSYLDSVEEDIKVLEKTEKLAKGLRDDANSIKTIISSITKLENDIEAFSNIVSMEDDVNEILQLWDYAEQLSVKKESLKALITKLRNTNKKIAELRNLIDLDEQVSEILDLMAQKEINVAQFDKLSNLVQNIYEVEKDLKNYNKIYEECIAEWNTNATGGFCPTCGNLIKEIQ